MSSRRGDESRTPHDEDRRRRDEKDDYYHDHDGSWFDDEYDDESDETRSGRRGRRHRKEPKKRKRSKSERRHKEERRGSRSRDNSDSDEEEDDSSSSIESSEKDRRRRRERNDRKRSKKSSRDDDDRRKRKKKDRKRDDDRGERKSSRRRKEEKRRRHHHRDQNESDGSDNDNDDNQQRRGELNAIQLRNRDIARSIFHVLSSHPALATDLPVLLVRLCGGTSFDLTQMTDPGARAGLESVLRTLEPFGVVRTDTTTAAGSNGGTGVWVWKPPEGSSSSSSSSSSHELILIRLIRSLLDEMGLTMHAVSAFEARRRIGEVGRFRSDKAALKLRDDDTKEDESALANVERLTTIVLRDFSPHKLAGELVTVVEMLLRGECVSLQGVTDLNLRSRLEALLSACGLRLQPIKSEETSKTGKDGGAKAQKETPLMGYAIPDDTPSVEAMCRAKLGLVLRICNDTRSAFADGKTGSLSSDDDDEEEGPAPCTAASARKGPSLPPEALKAQAARRTMELECAKAGVAPPPLASSATGNDGQREEWMLVPGKFDFLGSIQSSSLRNRTFENKRGGDDTASEKVLDPAVQAEIQRIMQAHEQARGPSLMEMHQQRKKREAEEAAAAGTAKKGSSWKWNRDKDLDAGRSVDRNALDRVYGNASNDLKSKFQGGFG